jgi:hypothetical protein
MSQVLLDALLPAFLDIMVGDALDEAGKNFLRLISGRMFHTLISRDAGPVAAH